MVLTNKPNGSVAMYDEIGLAGLLAGVIVVDPVYDRTVTGITCDSRQVQMGDLFIATVGQEHDGRNYIDEAIRRGAVAIIAEAGLEHKATANKDIPILFAEQLREHIGKIAARFYSNPSRFMNVIGVTGTNGKTSCSYFLAQALQTKQEHCAVIGTLGYGGYNNLNSSIHTTPDAIQLQRVLAEMRDKYQYVAMEVSSHGLDQARVKQIDFNMAIFTNLSRDHLDYHGDMQAYAEAKKKLFHQFGLQHAIINIDDSIGREIISELPEAMQAYSYSTENPAATVYASDIKLTAQGMQAKVYTPWGEDVLETSLLGRFNLSNLLAVLTCLGILNVPLAEALQRIKKLHGVPGRMQVVGGGTKPTVVIDYSHTPDALEKALTALREHCSGKLWCVFGCGGDRDKGKRPLMGKIAQQHADQIIVTDDNPRYEDPKQIIAEIVKGLKLKKNVRIEHDRYQAIQLAISQAKNQDVILVAGKGHETYQLIRDERREFSDVKAVQQLVKSI